MECVGDQSGAIQMHLETLIEDSMGTVCSQAPWTMNVPASFVCPIRSLLKHHYPFSDLRG